MEHSAAEQTVGPLKFAASNELSPNSIFSLDYAGGSLDLRLIYIGKYAFVLGRILHIKGKSDSLHEGDLVVVTLPEALSFS